KAVEVSKRVGIVEIERDNKKNSRLNAYESIQTAMEKGRMGFKRKYVRC
ncbi:MAG: DNA alkylation repair protein, partial [Planococcus donghaensis]